MEFLFYTFIVLLIVIDPLGNAPIFMALTHNVTAAYRRQMAIRGIALATAILLVFLLIGNTLLKALGIGISAFRIAGGILLFLLATWCLRASRDCAPPLCVNSRKRNSSMTCRYFRWLFH